VDTAVPPPEQRVAVRWCPTALLDLSPSEPAAAIRTPHRVMLQGLPASREALAALVRAQPFELVLEVDDDNAPLRHVPVHDVHEARLTPDLPLDWSQFYWLSDGLLEDLAQSADPTAGFRRGRLRLALAEEILREARRGRDADVDVLRAAWEVPPAPPAPDVERHGEPPQALQQYVRGFTGHLLEHAASRLFVEQASALLQQAESTPGSGLPVLGAADHKTLASYAQHRLFGSPWMTAPAGMIAGWHLLFSTHVLAVWYAGLMMQAKRSLKSREALLSALWLLEQGLWRDEALLHDVLRTLNASEYTSLELAVSLAAALGATHART
jgi:hypothetical protein